MDSFSDSPFTRVTPPNPSPVNRSRSDTGEVVLSPSTSSSETENEVPRKSRLDRPRLAGRQKSSSIIIPKGKAGVQTEISYPPDDARAMSPRRNSDDIERLGNEARQSLKDQAETLQSSLAALTERIDEVKSDHDKLENENRFLQDYIGGLTRTMSKTEIGSTSGTGKGKK